LFFVMSLRSRAASARGRRCGATVSTPADELRGLNMAAVWGVVAFIVAVFGLGVQPWDALERALANHGPNEEEKTLIAFVAGYTLPLTGGVAVLTFAWLSGAARNVTPQTALVVGALTLIGAGLVAKELGLGLLPSTEFKPVNGPIYVALPGDVLQAYFNSYGFPLMICSVAIGAASAVQVERWAHAAAA
jgi:hypothetical protein